MTARYKVLVRNPNGSLGGLVTTWRSLDIYLRYNAVGSIAVTMSPTDPAVSLLGAGAGILIRRNGVPLISGPVEHSTADMDAAASNPPPGTVVIAASDDLVYLDDRLVALDGTHDLNAQPAGVSAPTVTGPAETLIVNAVTANASAAAPVAARRTLLSVAPDQGRGGVQTRTYAFDNLLAYCGGIALTAGLGFRALQGPAGPVFSVYVPTDRSGSVMFSAARHNLASYHAETALGTTNYVLSVGSPSGTDAPRTYASAANATSPTVWGRRRESVAVSSGTTDLPTLTTTAQQALASGVDLSTFTFVPLPVVQIIDNKVTQVVPAAIAFGQAYNLGDIVAASLGGLTLTGTVSAVHLTVDSNGEVVTPTVAAGDPSATGATLRLPPGPGGTRLVGAVRDILTRLQGRL